MLVLHVAEVGREDGGAWKLSSVSRGPSVLDSFPGPNFPSLSPVTTPLISALTITVARSVIKKLIAGFF
jgi:hypothetical protein